MPLFVESINRQLIELNQYPAYLVGKSVELICRDTSHPSHAGFCTHQNLGRMRKGVNRGKLSTKEMCHQVECRISSNTNTFNSTFLK